MHIKTTHNKHTDTPSLVPELAPTLRSDLLPTGHAHARALHAPSDHDGLYGLYLKILDCDVVDMLGILCQVPTVFSAKFQRSWPNGEGAQKTPCDALIR